MARTPLWQFLRRAIAQAQTRSDPPPAAMRSRLLSRRRFIGYSALAAGSAIATTTLARAHTKGGYASTPTPKIAIVGGGLAGLNAAYQLHKIGLTATVYEAKATVGGRVQSQEGLAVRGLINDLGGCFINTDHADMLTLVDELGLELFDRTAVTAPTSPPEVAYYFQGRRITEAELIDHLRPIADQIGKDAADLDADFDGCAAIFDVMSVKDYLDFHRDKIPAPYVRSLIEAGIRTEYGVEPHASSALQLLYNLPSIQDDRVEVLSSDETYLVKQGSGAIPQALAAKLEGYIYTGWRLQALRSRGSGFTLTFDQGTVEADYVILAMPFPAMRRVEMAVDLPDGLRRFIQEVDLGRNEKVLAGFRDRAWHQTAGFTGEAWTDLGYSQVWEDTQRQPEFRQGVLTFYLGGDEVSVSDAKALNAGAELVGRLDEVLPGLAVVAGDRGYRTNWHQDPDIGGGYTSFRPGQYLEFSEFMYIESDDPAERQDVQVGNLVFAGEQFSDEFYGYMNGAAQTGRLAAEVVASQVLSPA